MMDYLPERLILRNQYQVTSADTDSEARLRPGALLNFLIQSAIQSADHLGFGFGNLNTEQLFWVLSRITVKIHRTLKWYEELTVETWPKDIDGLLYIRDFRVTDRKGEEVALATSGWLAIDFGNHRPKKIESLDAGMLDNLKARHALRDRPEKLPPVPACAGQLIRPVYFDFDLNRHVTSTRYIDWMMDSLPFEFHGSHEVAEFTINYMKETRPGDLMHIRYRFEEPDATFEGNHSEEGPVSFRGHVRFRPAQ